MPNPLTGDYEAVLQISVRQINGLLATLHQNGARNSGRSPSLLHTVANLRIGSRPRSMEFGIAQAATWLGSRLQNTRSLDRPAITVSDLPAKAPPGLRRRFEGALADIASAATEVVAAGTVRGWAEVQISTPAVSLLRGDVFLHAYVRARFLADPGSAPLPKPIHGEVRVRYQPFPLKNNGGNALDFRIPSGDASIQFFPLPTSGLSQADADAKLAPHIRRAVRQEFVITPIELPADFAFPGFTSLGSPGNLLDNTYRDALGSGSDQALVMPFQLSGAAAPASGLNGLTTLLLGSGSSQADLALAVSREFILERFQPTLTKLRQFSDTFQVPVPLWPDPTYRLSVTKAELIFASGFLDLVINAQARTRAAFFPDYTGIVVTQRMTLAVVGGQVTLRAADADLTITGVPGIATGQARSRVISARNSALPQSQASVTQAFQDALRRINDLLAKVDASASATYVQADVTPDGLVVRADIQTSDHVQPQVEIGSTDDAASFSGLASWIPGGRIDRHRWSWVETPVFVTPSGTRWTIPWRGRQRSSTDDHRFTFAVPQELQGRPTWDRGVCLEVEGVQLDAKGRRRPVAGSTASGSCRVTSHEPILAVDPLWESIFSILWRPDPPPEGRLLDAVAGHVNVLAHPRPPGGLTANGLIHFVGAEPEQPLVRLGRALAATRRDSLSLLVVLVLPEGSLRQRGQDLEAVLGMAGATDRGLIADEPIESSRRERNPGVRLIVTEDVQGGWSRAFANRSTPSTYLMNAYGDFVWKQEGLDIEALAAALDEHCLPVPAPRTLPLQLAVQPGESAPEAAFAQDRILSLTRLRGRTVWLLFLQAWSAPCLQELEHHQREQLAGQGRDVELVVINAGQDHSLLEERQRGAARAFRLIHDPDQRISQLYGVTCWPTTVSINPAGIIDRIQFGTSHRHADPDRSC